jgi:hypothetical protein
MRIVVIIKEKISRTTPVTLSLRESLLGAVVLIKIFEKLFEKICMKLFLNV